MDEQGFPQIDGLDTAVGLQNVVGNADLYRKILLRFRDSSLDFGVKFRSAQADEDPNAALREAHTLKGLAATLGANTVQVAAQRLEAACREGAAEQEVNQLLGNVVSALLPVIAALDALG